MGIENAGMTCYVNSVLQLIREVIVSHFNHHQGIILINLLSFVQHETFSLSNGNMKASKIHQILTLQMLRNA